MLKKVQYISCVPPSDQWKDYLKKVMAVCNEAMAFGCGELPEEDEAKKEVLFLKAEYNCRYLHRSKLIAPALFHRILLCAFYSLLEKLALNIRCITKHVMVSEKLFVPKPSEALNELFSSVDRLLGRLGRKLNKCATEERPIVFYTWFKTNIRQLFMMALIVAKCNNEGKGIDPVNFLEQGKMEVTDMIKATANGLGVNLLFFHKGEPVRVNCKRSRYLEPPLAEVAADKGYDCFALTRRGKEEEMKLLKELLERRKRYELMDEAGVELHKYDIAKHFVSKVEKMRGEYRSLGHQIKEMEATKEERKKELGEVEAKCVEVKSQISSQNLTQSEDKKLLLGIIDILESRDPTLPADCESNEKYLQLADQCIRRASTKAFDPYDAVLFVAKEAAGAVYEKAACWECKVETEVLMRFGECHPTCQIGLCPKCLRERARRQEGMEERICPFCYTPLAQSTAKSDPFK